MFDARVKAVLGPTNTGKTHLAITRLLAHSSGIIGFPLRLLARENYDRMVAQKGEKHVALITGEEKIVPPDAKWFACTVEAMPLDRRTEFLAVDEIQLCADPDRGHVFTDRLLNARGMVETMFLGAETIRPLLQRLVPKIEIDTRARLSKLAYAGPAKLTRLPPRSAVVAFSAAEVYAIAEAIRRRRGGCAVVMGRLSPRTRNAQVALYQNREVDFLVATDAIGMGLNMDVDHVAFAALQKFDGHAARGLTPQEAAQIAGRAGRGMRDGTFGTTGDSPALDDAVVEKIETHSFEPLQTLAWRNSELEFASVDALLDSLAAPPPQIGLSKGHDAVDHVTLELLSREPEIRALAQGRSRVRLLWDACQVPDFRKLADDSHTVMCRRIFTHLAQDERLPADWVTQQIAQCAMVEGDLDTLMARLANIRVWSYVAARADWLDNANQFQAMARAAEDSVSDALHERLTARFVDRRAAHLIRRLDDTDEELLSAVTRRGDVVVEGHPVGRIEGFVFIPVDTPEGEEERKLILRAARRALKEEMPRRVALLETGKDDAFALTGSHRLSWTHPGGEPAEIARLRAGPEPSKPQVEVLPSEFLDGAQKERVRARLAKFVEALIARELGAIAAVETKAEADNTLRGPAFLLRESLGLAPGGTDPRMGHELRQKLKTIGIRAGRYALFLPEALKPRAMALRAQIWALSRNIPTPELPPAGLISLPLREPEPPPPPALAPDEYGPPTPAPPVARNPRGRDRDAALAALAESWPAGFAETMGWFPAGPVLLRLDVAERIAGELAYLTRRAPAPPPGDLASRLGVRGDTLGVALAALGFRLLEPPPAEPGMFGPPTPLRVQQLRPERAFEGRRGNDRPPSRNQASGRAPAGAEAGNGPASQAPGNRDRRPARGPRIPDQRPPRDRGGPDRAADRAGPADAAPAMATDGGAAAGAGRDDRRGASGGDARPPRRAERWQPSRGEPRQGGRGESWQEPRREPRPPPEKKQPDPDSPFAVLAKLKLR